MIVSIARELGAGGRTVGDAVASALGASLLDERSFIELLADRSGLPRDYVAQRIERPPNAGERLMAEVAAASAMLPIPLFQDRDEDQLVDSVRDVVLDHANRGHVVVIGHGGVSMLGWRPNGVRVLAVLLRASRGWRVGQLARRYGIARDEAQRRIARTDEARARYVKHYFDMDLYDPTQYDAVLNTETIGLERAIAIVRDLALAFASGEATPIGEPR
jgi:cytidylate kinase